MSRPWSSKLIPEELALELQELGYTSDSERRFFETLWRSGGPTAISRYLSGFDAADKERRVAQVAGTSGYLSASAQESTV